VPPSVARLFGLRIPAAGGGYFRLYPYFLLRWLLRRVETEDIPLVMYLHPWEIDPDQPRMDGPLLSRIRHYLNLSRTEKRLKKLLNDFEFAPICDAIVPVNRLCGEKQSMANSIETCLRPNTCAMKTV
jgi:hypothetical protein